MLAMKTARDRIAEARLDIDTYEHVQIDRGLLPTTTWTTFSAALDEEFASNPNRDSIVKYYTVVTADGMSAAVDIRGLYVTRQEWALYRSSST